MAAGLLVFGGASVLAQTTNTWGTLNGKWETPGNWDNGAPSITQALVRIMQSVAVTVTIDQVTTNSPDTLTISNLTVAAGVAGINTLQLTNAPVTPLRILNALTIGTGGALLVTNSSVRVDRVGGLALVVDGSATVRNGGVLAASNTSLRVGSAGIGSLTVQGGTLLVSNLTAGALNGSQGTLTLAGGTNQIFGMLLTANLGAATGAIWLTAGQLVATNFGPVIGHFGPGQFTMSNGTFLARNLTVGNAAGSRGTFTVAGGTNTLTSVTGFTIANNLDSTGTVWVTGGRVELGSNLLGVGAGGIGQLTVSNGTVVGVNGQVGILAGATGTLTVAGGSLVLTNGSQTGTLNVQPGALHVTAGALVVNQLILTNAAGGCFLNNGTLTVNGSSLVDNAQVFGVGGGGGTAELLLPAGTHAFTGGLAAGAVGGGTTGRVWVTGGTLDSTGGTLTLGGAGAGSLVVSNGVTRVTDARLGPTVGGRGSWLVAGGTNSVYASLVLGDYPCTTTGVVVVLNGRLAVTNALANATLDVRSGAFQQFGGEVMIDRIVVTNSCGRFIHDGGLLFTNSAPVLAPFFDADGDGMWNQFEQDHGFDPFWPTDAAQDADGDGNTNLDEQTTGTDPNDADSLLRIIAIAQEGDDIRVTWTTAAGRVYRLQGAPNVSFTAAVTNLSDFLYFGGPGESTTNAVHTGGATNTPAFFYRISGQID